VVGTSNCLGERLGGELWSKDLLAVELHELLEVLLMDFLANSSSFKLQFHEIPALHEEKKTQHCTYLKNDGREGQGVNWG
jgi:hypothetical protein